MMWKVFWIVGVRLQKASLPCSSTIRSSTSLRMEMPIGLAILLAAGLRRSVGSPSSIRPLAAWAICSPPWLLMYPSVLTTARPSRRSTRTFKLSVISSSPSRPPATGSDLLPHHHDGAVGARLDLDLVDEAADESQPPAALAGTPLLLAHRTPEHRLGEPYAVVAHGPLHELGALGAEQREVDVDAAVAGAAVLGGVDERLLHRQAQLVHAVGVHARLGGKLGGRLACLHLLVGGHRQGQGPLVEPTPPSSP